jgi:hypothetical protein
VRRRNGRFKEVETAKLRIAFEKSGLTKTQLAKRLGWHKADMNRVNKALGYKPDYTRGTKRKKVRQTTSYYMAVRLCRAMNALPYDCGV